MKEKIIVSLTSWPPRFPNVPKVLDSIFTQTIIPDLVVINISADDVLPENLRDYFVEHNVFVNYVPDTKVYKKLIPTLKMFPNDCVISIDDDWIYPSGMIEEFINIHRQYPEFPISGNHVVCCGLQCHCGCASLTKAEYFGEWLNMVDDLLISHCDSDDMTYTYFANMANHPYIRTNNQYFTNMEPYNGVQAYSPDFFETDNNPAKRTFNYLCSRFGGIESGIYRYFTDSYLRGIVCDINERNIRYYQNEYSRIKSSWSFKLGNLLLKPFSLIRRLINKSR